MAARNTKFLLMANPPKETKNKSSTGTDRGPLTPPNVTKSVLVAAAADRDRPFSIYLKSGCPKKTADLVGRWEVKIYRLNSLRLASGLGGIT
jgi:hypothetical protein